MTAGARQQTHPTCSDVVQVIASKGGQDRGRRRSLGRSGAVLGNSHLPTPAAVATGAEFQ